MSACSNRNRFLLYFLNSLIVTGTATLLASSSACPPATASRGCGRTRPAIVVLIARMTPGLSYLIPLFLLFQWLGLIGTLCRRSSPISSSRCRSSSGS